MRDARGRVVALVSLRRLKRTAPQTDEHRERLRDARRQIAVLGRSLRWTGAGVLFLLSVVAGLFIAQYDGFDPFLWSAVFLIALGAAGIAFSGLGRGASRVRDIALRCDLCASCGSGISPGCETDGCSLCPDCGAAWRLD